MRESEARREKERDEEEEERYVQPQIFMPIFPAPKLPLRVVDVHPAEVLEAYLLCEF